MLRQRKRIEERRRHRHRVDRRTDVVCEAGERELRRPASAADGVLGFEDRDLEAGLRERDGGCESVRSRADDDGARASAGDVEAIPGRVRTFDRLLRRRSRRASRA